MHGRNINNFRIEVEFLFLSVNGCIRYLLGFTIKIICNESIIKYKIFRINLPKEEKGTSREIHFKM